MCILPKKGFVQLGHDVETIIGSAYPGFGPLLVQGYPSKLKEATGAGVRPMSFS
jgi:hypothetical protein